MSLKIEGIEINGQNTVFVRDIQINPNPEKFREEDGLALVTCPSLVEVAIRARQESYEDKYCQGCHKASVKWISLTHTYQVSGKCPDL